ncbi:MAG: efflux RND transporter periplasmic adaptor subunit [Verrucomicrobiia bacterium]
MKKVVVGALCVLFVVGVLWVVQKRHASSGKLRGATARTGPPPVPVVAGTVAQKDVPIYLDGLGTVQAFNTVTVHVQVDGRLQKVAFVEGQDVRAGDLLAQIDPELYRAQVEQAEAKKAQDEAQLANARLDLKRDAEQLAAKIIAQQVYDTQRALVDQLDATVKADQAAIDLANVQLGYTTIVSPIDGRTGIRVVDQGNIVRVTDPNGLVVIAQLRPISVVFTLPEQNLNEIQKELAAGEISVLAVDRDNRTVLCEGKLAVIDNQIDTTTGTIRVKATFPNDDLRLWPGQFVNARLLLTTRKGGIVVPASVVQRGPEGSYAFVINEDQTVEVRPVKVAQIEAGQALIDKGLQAGESVVVDGQYRLQAGSKVKLVPTAKPADTES